MTFGRNEVDRSCIVPFALASRLVRLERSRQLRTPPSGSPARDAPFTIKRFHPAIGVMLLLDSPTS